MARFILELSQCSQVVYVKADNEADIRSCHKHVSYVRFEVFKAVTMKNADFLDVAPCSFSVNRIASIFRVEESENEEPARASSCRLSCQLKRSAI
jgi:hypothetical protein